MKNVSIHPEQSIQPAHRIVRHEQKTKALPICDILHEINKLNDKALTDLLGKLDFNRINIQYYNVDILDVVSADKMLTFTSTAGYYGSDAVEIKLLITQQVGNTEKTIIKGNFIYTIKSTKSTPFLNRFFHILNTTDHGIKTWGRSARL